MGKTFKNVAAEIVRMVDLDQKKKELAVNAEIQKDLDTIKVTDEKFRKSKQKGICKPVKESGETTHQIVRG